MWQWSNFLTGFAETSGRVVHINMDETGIRLLQIPGQGLITEVARRAKRSARGLKRAATKHQTRGMFTLAVLVCDDDTVQQILPQVLIIGSGIMTARERQSVENNLPRNVHLWTAEKCWMTSQLMARLIRLVRSTVSKTLPDINIVFSADAYRAHITQSVWRAMAAAGILYYLIPARMTAVLQPCDVAVFARFKKQLAMKMQQREINQTAGTTTVPDLILEVCATIDTAVRAISWRQTFASCGLVGHQREVSNRVLEQLSMQNQTLMPRELPSLNQLKEVFPVNTVIPINCVFEGVRRKLKPQGAAQPLSVVEEEPEEPPLPAPWIARLRRTRARAARVSQPVAAAEASASAVASQADSQHETDTPHRQRDPGLFPTARRLLPPRLPQPPSSGVPGRDPA